MRHHEESIFISASPTQVFDYVDDHARLAAHMSKSSWMMGGGHMNVEVDERRGQTVGSHIRLRGKVFGIPLFLDEAVSHRVPPRAKVWATVGTPRLLVIGHYRMGTEIDPENGGSRLRVFIDYELPSGAITRCLGYMFGGLYAKWCVRQMIDDVLTHFTRRTAVPSPSLRRPA